MVRLEEQRLLLLLLHTFRLVKEGGHALSHMPRFHVLLHKLLDLLLTYLSVVSIIESLIYWVS